VEPDYPDPEDILISAYEALAAQKLTRALAAQKVARMVDAVYTKGLQHIRAAQWSEAVECFEKVQHQKPGYRNTKSLLLQVHQALDDHPPQQHITTEFSKEIEQDRAEGKQRLDLGQQVTPDEETRSSQTTEPSPPAELQKHGSLGLFCSYSHKDESYLDEFKIHAFGLVDQGLIRHWYDREVLAGEEWEGVIEEKLRTSQIIVLLISPDFMYSLYIREREVKQALERHARGEARVIPIIVRSIYLLGLCTLPHAPSAS
jgi:hypothetical protein